MFRYTPSTNDVVGFDLTITARGAQGQETEAAFTVAPYPILPAEESVIQSVIPEPDPESGDYVVHADVESPAPEPWYGTNRTTRAVSVAGKVLVLAEGHPNRVLARYSFPDQDIKTFDLYAERVVLRNPMYLQGATITIYARELVYENGATFLDAKQVTHVSGPITWLQPPTLRIILAYARDLYISGRGPQTRALLQHYRDFLEGMAASAAWGEYSEEAQNEFDQMHGEMTSLLWNLDRNLDYFGNPAGWVPNLSFEVNLGVFSSEIGPAIRLLYLSYWLGHVAKQVEVKVAAMTTTRETLHEDNLTMVEQVEALQEEIPLLEEQAAALAVEITQLQQRIKEREEQLRREYEKSKKRNRWRQIAKQAGGIMQVFPVGQPILASIGTGLNVISSLDKNSSVTDWAGAFGAFKGIAANFTAANFKTSWESVVEFGQTLKPLDPRDIQWTIGGLKEYYKKANEVREVVSKEVKTIQDALKKVELPAVDAEAKIAELKATAPEFNQRSGDGVIDGLLDQIARKVVEQSDLANKVTECVKTMNLLTDSIHRNLLAMDGLSQDISRNHGALNLRAITYLKDMEKRSKERLLKYQYYMAKAYEYRLLSAYEGDLNLGTLFDKLVTLAEADSDGNGVLSQANFEILSGIYDEQVALIAERLVDRYNREPHGWTYPFTYRLSPAQIGLLNRGEPVTFNFVEDCFPQDREDLQINELHIDMAVTGTSHPNEQFILEARHSGVSRMKRGNDVYLFRHSNTTSESPFQREHPFHWQVQYDSNTGRVTERVPGRGDVSLLRFLLTLRGVPEVDSKVGLFTRAGLWSDLTLQRSDASTGTLSHYQIGEVLLHGTYDFRDQPNSRVALDVATANEGVYPFIRLDRIDLGKRRDGVRRFHRVYARSAGTVVRLSAPEWFGYWKFDRWTDCEGNELGRNPSLAVRLDGNRRVTVHYLNTDTDEDSMPDPDELLWFGTLAQGTEHGPDGDLLNNFAETVYGTNPSMRDTDGDGFDDGVEVQVGSDPTNRDSTPLHIREVEDMGSGRVRLVWASEPGVNYVVESTSDLGSGTWIELGQVRAAGTTSEITLQTVGSPHFFRIKTGGPPSVLPPQVTTEPADATVPQGGSATLRVEATGSEPLSYQWYRGSRGDVADPVPNGTGASFTTPPLAATTKYWVRVSNAAGLADSRAATVHVLPPQPGGLEVYVSSASADTVSVVVGDTMDLRANIPVGNIPRGLAASPDGSRVFVANNGSGTVSVIDTASQRVVSTIPVGTEPIELAISRDGLRLYVGNSGSASLSVIDTTTLAVVATVPMPLGPTCLAYHPVRDEIWIGYGRLLEVRSTATYEVLASLDSTEPFYASTGLVFPSDGSEVFGVEGCGCCGRFHRLSGMPLNGAIPILQSYILYDGAGSAGCAAVNPRTGAVYLAKSGHCISPRQPRIHEFGTGRTIELADGARAMAVDAAANELWVAQGDGALVLVDLAAWVVKGTAEIGLDAQAIVLVRR